MALIPARSGSKRIIDKNIRLLLGKPLIAYSIQQALKSKYIDKVIVSTDSEKYVEISKNYGAEAPFLRPAELSGDLSPDLETFQHAIKWLELHENYVPDLCVHLRPTYPIRKIEDINKCIQLLMNDQTCDSIRSITVSRESPYKMWFREEDGFIRQVINGEKGSSSLPIQSLPVVYMQNACIDVIRTSTIMKDNSMTGSKVKGFLMENNYDIDKIKDFELIERIWGNLK